MKCPSIHRFQKWILESKKPSLYKGVHVLALRSGEEFHFIEDAFFSGYHRTIRSSHPQNQKHDWKIRGAAAAPLRAKRSGMRRYTDLPSRTWRPLDERRKACTVHQKSSLNGTLLPVLPGPAGPTKQQKALFKGRMEDDFPFGETMDG